MEERMRGGNRAKQKEPMKRLRTKGKNRGNQNNKVRKKWPDESWRSCGNRAQPFGAPQVLGSTMAMSHGGRSLHNVLIEDYFSLLNNGLLRA
jgi:hypothetical protein